LSRHALWPSAEANQLLPTPVGPISADPFALDELLEHDAVETAGTAIVDILDAGLLAQFGDAQPSGEAFVLAQGGLAIKQEP
jgi:hypothetical protein